MSSIRVDVKSSGAVLLGKDISCDGFNRDFKVRVQTHIHLDHMYNFETSKGCQDIFLSEPSQKLLISEHNADLLYRNNLISVQKDEIIKIGESKLELIPSDHMLGAVQVGVEMQDGVRLGYSGDFNWPLEDVIQVDELVLDSTYGGPHSVRIYSQQEAEEKLLSIVLDKLNKGPIHIKAHRGTIQRGLHVLSEIECCPLLASSFLCEEIEVYREFGYPLGSVLSIDTDEGRKALQNNRYIRFYGKGDRFPIEIIKGTTITLSAYMANTDDPVVEYSERALSVALSDHADFNDTIEYVKATGAKFILTDNSRGGHAVDLALEINRLLGIKSAPSQHKSNLEWGD